MNGDDAELVEEVKAWIVTLYGWRENRLAGLLQTLLNSKMVTLHKEVFMREVSVADEPLVIGTRVYVRSLDVFGKIAGWREFQNVVDLRFTYHVQCEAPMPFHTHSCTRAGLYMA